MQYFTGRVGQKIVWDSKTSTNFCGKIMLYPKKIRFPLEIRLKFLTFLPKSIVFSKKIKNKSLQLKLVPSFTPYVLKL